MRKINAEKCDFRTRALGMASNVELMELAALLVCQEPEGPRTVTYGGSALPAEMAVAMFWIGISGKLLLRNGWARTPMQRISPSTS